MSSSVVPYNGTTGKADSGHSTGVSDLNIFYDVRFLFVTLIQSPNQR
jgi:Amt family ammonium transporter